MAVAAARHELWISTPEEGAAIELDVLQGLWTEAQYLRLTDAATRLVQVHLDPAVDECATRSCPVTSCVSVLTCRLRSSS